MFRTTLITLIATAALAVPAAASAADFYVDQAAGDDGKTCTAPGADACRHIQAAVVKAGPNDTVHVSDPTAQTIYAENVTVLQGESLVSDSPDRTENVIDGGATGAGVNVFGQIGGRATITGFTIRGRKGGSLLASHPVAVANNVFDEPGPITGGYSSEVFLSNGADGSKFSKNTFLDPDPVPMAPQTGIDSLTPGAVEIVDNRFADLTTGIFVDTSSTGHPLVAGNEITGLHSDGSSSTAIEVQGGQPVISGNSIGSPSPVPGQFLVGIRIGGYYSPQVGATLRRNRIVGMSRGVDVQAAQAGVSLEGDLIAASTNQGLYISDPGADDPGQSDTTATNVTIVGAGTLGHEVMVGQAKLTLDSSIIGALGIHVADAGGGTCAISYSRGPAIGSAADGCDGFQTAAHPGFVHAAAGDYHLTPGSPMLDAGNPAAPPAGAVDLDGDDRALASTCPGGPGTRDIGADELATCVPPPPPPPPPPATPDPPSGMTDPPTGTDEPSGGTEQPANPDTDAPETTLTRSPRKRSARRSARFGFTADEPGSSFLCKLDRGQFTPCSSPTKLKRLHRGRHRFEVAAVDAGGNVDPTPAAYRFRTRASRH